MSLVTVRVEVPEGQREPKQKLDQGEHIVKKLVPIRGELYCISNCEFANGHCSTPVHRFILVPTR